MNPDNAFLQVVPREVREMRLLEVELLAEAAEAKAEARVFCLVGRPSLALGASDWDSLAFSLLHCRLGTEPARLPGGT